MEKILLSDLNYGWLTIVIVIGVIINLILLGVFVYLRENYIIKKRSPSSSIIFVISTLISGSYLAYLVEAPAENVSCDMRYLEGVTNTLSLLGGFTRAEQLLMADKINVFLYVNRKRRIDGKKEIKPDFFQKHAWLFSNYYWQAGVYIFGVLFALIIWGILSSTNNLECGPNTSTELKYIMLFICIGYLLIMSLDLKRLVKRDPLLTFREVIIDCFSVLGMIIVYTSIVQTNKTEGGRMDADATLAIYFVYMHIPATLGVPLFKIFSVGLLKNKSSESRSDVSLAKDVTGLRESGSPNSPALPSVPASLEDILKGQNPEILTSFLKFARKELSIEGVEFLMQVDSFLEEYQNNPDFNRSEFNIAALMIYRNFLGPRAPYSVNISGALFNKLRSSMATPSIDTETDDHRFKTLTSARNEVYRLVQSNTFSRYCRVQKHKQLKRDVMVLTL